MKMNKYFVGFLIVVATAIALTTFYIIEARSSQPTADNPSDVSAVISAETSVSAEQSDDASENVPQQIVENAGATNWMLLIQALSIVLSIILAGISFFLFRSRISLDTTGALVPERWGQTIVDLASVIEKQQEALLDSSSASAHAAQRAEGALQQIGEQTTSLKEMLLSFQDALNAKDAAIAELEKGRDFQVNKKLLGELVDLHSKALNYCASEPDNKLLNSFAVLLEQVLEDNEIEIGWPEIGTQFQDHPELLEAIGHVQQAEDAFKTGDIADVLSPYYRHQGLKFATVIRKAKIKYYLGSEG
ncbi:hypothetical protein RYZ18_07245 [Roseovarius sp. 10]|uniref:hypothetical protein n=1 Tax=Roseovarius sp. 10 TaxID=3080563 RepID=UPI002952F00B|nr:hypothetical protein [Roseovarius sp. 10]MDV7201114.1 hypothetical protein [Roseovarius sp. 10]